LRLSAVPIDATRHVSIVISIEQSAGADGKPDDGRITRR